MMRLRRFKLVSALGAVMLVATLTSPALAVSGEGTARAPAAAPSDRTLDVRQLPEPVTQPSAAQRAAARALGIVIRWDGITGVPQTVIKPGGFLTGPAREGADPVRVARSFLSDYAALWRFDSADVSALRVVSVVPSVKDAATHVWFQQTAGPLDVFGAILGVTVDARGRIAWAGGPVWPEASLSVPGVLSAEEAARRAARAGGWTGAPRQQVPPRQVLFPLPAGGGRPAWFVIVETGPTAVHETVVDAVTGDILFRRNQYQHGGPQGTVFQTQNPDVAGAARVVTSFAGAAFNNNGWVDDRTTAGNNVTAFHDTNGDGASDYTPQTPASGDPAYQHFDYPFANAYETSADYTTDRDATITQAFYYTNLAHDHWYPYGFDEASRNFQNDNFGRGGSGGDAVIVLVDFNADGGACCNAFFGTPGDGAAPTMQLYIEGAPTDTTRFGHGAFDGDTVFHEFGHGVHNRLVNGGMGNGSGEQTGGLGEGWGDVMAYSFWNDPILFEYVTTNKTTGLRRVAYDTSTQTFTSICQPGCEVHNDGEVWATALWDVRVHLIARRGQADGVTRFEQIMIDGMKNTGGSPNFLDARDGIFVSESTIYGDADYCGIWNAFAINGMGTDASSPTQLTPSNGFNVPPECVPTAAPGGPYSVAEGSPVTLDASGSSAGTHPSTGALSYAWDLDGDGAYDDATGSSPTIGPFGDNTSFMVGLQVTNAAGITRTATAPVTITNVAPAGGFVAGLPTSINEGDFFALDLRFTDPGWLDTYSATIEWGDGEVSPVSPTTLTAGGPGTPDSMQVTASHAYGDNGSYPITVRVRDDDAGELVAVHDLAVGNVAPSVGIDADQVTSTVENGGVTLGASFTDPGWLDTYEVTVDWGAGGGAETVTPVITEGGPGTPDRGTISATHVYGDNGTFPVTLTVRDDDAGTTSTVIDVTVDNLDPVATINEGTTILVNGIPTLFADVGQTVPITGRVQDEGSDDETVTWDWDDGSPLTPVLFRNDPAFDDPFPSPSINPRDFTTEDAHAWQLACLYELGLDLEDDDGGTGSDSLKVLITAPPTLTRGAGYWQHQYKGNGRGDFSVAQLDCYLEIAGYLSNVFDEVRDASTRARAHDDIFVAGKNGSAIEQLDREILAAWINFANGGFEYTELLDADGNGVPDTTFIDLLTSIETLRLDPASTRDQILAAKDTLGRLNGRYGI